jgi:16S rRNA (guanine527-N7)-methyltransferase
VRPAPEPCPSSPRAAEARRPEVAAAIEVCFGEQAPKARRYADLLAGPGIEHGLIGPREADRIWRRHLFNSAAVSPLIPAGATVLDIGSGAGLPGIPVALARPDLTMTLLEPMARRVRFLERCLADLDLPAVSVVQGRAPDTELRAQVVLARAVAPLPTLVALALPLCRPRGYLLALKGRGVEAESAELTHQSGLDTRILKVEDAVGELAYVARVAARRAPGGRGRRSSPRHAPRRPASPKGTG